MKYNECLKNQQQIPSTILQAQINEIKEKVNEIDDYCKNKEYYNGIRQAKIDQVIEEIDDIEKDQKRALKILLSDSEGRNNNIEKRVSDNEKDISDLKIAIFDIPNNIINKIAKLLAIFGTGITFIVSVIMYFNDIIIFLMNISK